MKREPEELFPIAPLPEARWSRIERSLFERLGREEGAGARPPAGEIPAGARRLASRRPFAWAVVALGVAAALAAVLRTSNGGPSRSALRPVHVQPVHVQTEASGSRLDLTGATIDVDPRSELLVTRDDGDGVVIALEAGRVLCDVSPRKAGAVFLVQAGRVGVRVVGTRFAVQRSGADVSVDVERGTVEVTDGASVQAVHAGERWPQGARPIAEGPPSLPPVGLQDAVSSPSTTAPSVDGPRPPPPPSKARRLADVAATSPSRHAAYEKAARLEATDPAAALAGYRELALGVDDWAADALYAAARLQADRGDRADATALAREYLTRFSVGPNAADARRVLEWARDAASRSR